MGIRVDELEWDETNLEHCTRHGLTAEIAESIRSKAPEFFRETRKGRTGTHAMVGPSADGRSWTVKMIRTNRQGVWRPITGWPSTNSEIRSYRSSRLASMNPKKGRHR